MGKTFKAEDVCIGYIVVYVERLVENNWKKGSCKMFNIWIVDEANSIFTDEPSILYDFALPENSEARKFYGLCCDDIRRFDMENMILMVDAKDSFAPRNISTADDTEWIDDIERDDYIPKERNDEKRKAPRRYLYTPTKKPSEKVVSDVMPKRINEVKGIEAFVQHHKTLEEKMGNYTNCSSYFVKQLALVVKSDVESIKCNIRASLDFYPRSQVVNGFLQDFGFESTIACEFKKKDSFLNKFIEELIVSIGKGGKL